MLVQRLGKTSAEGIRLQNHRIFTLRCLHKGLTPVSIKLKTTIRTEKARKIVRKAEKDLLQATVKAINSILDNVGKQTELCRSKIASILSTQRFRECQGFVEKVGEIRFNKVKQRQLNKFNNLLIKKEGNITWVSTQFSSSQACRQVPTLPGDSATCQAVSVPSQEGLVTSQADRQSQACRHSPSLPGRKLFFSFSGR